MIHSGLGYNQLFKLFSELNVPFISKSNLKAREEEAGQAIQEVAK